MNDLCVPFLADSNLKLSFNSQLFSLGLGKQDNLDLITNYIALMCQPALSTLLPYINSFNLYMLQLFYPLYLWENRGPGH